MKRAIVLIGVKNAGQLPTLEAAWSSVEEMDQWADGQGIPASNRIKITDEVEPVTLQRIWDTVNELVDRGVLEQLLIYFSGHGINNARNEYWLLSDAIVNPTQAVNVTASEDLARYSGIPHVVFVSDACRTAAVGVQPQGVTGGVIFPNLSQQGLEKPVDLFFATRLGFPALEIPTDGSDYKAIYTDTLLAALNGENPALRDHDAALDSDVVRAWPLKDFLATEVPRRVFAATSGSQEPDARITSPPTAWISILGPSDADAVGADPGVPPAAEFELDQLFTHAFRTVTESGPVDMTTVLGTADGGAAANGDTERSVMELTERSLFKSIGNASARTFGPLHFETGCGFKVDGARIIAAYAKTANVEAPDSEGALLPIELDSNQPENVLIVLESGRCVVLPALSEFMCALTFMRDDLVSVSYEPMDSSWRWSAFEDRRIELQNLRAVVAASSATGTFHLGIGEDEQRLARSMQIEKGLDPSLSVYAAYAYRDQGKRNRISEMANYQGGDLGLMLFDVAMLSRELDRRSALEAGHVFPFAPLLAQGWSLMPAHEIALPDSLATIRSHVVSTSLWTLYESGTADTIQSAMANSEV